MVIAKNKKGWMRILEATISVLIVSAVLIVVYSQQVDRGIDPAEYFYELEQEILSDIALRSDLRLNVLTVVVDNETDPNFVVIDNFVSTKVPDFAEYSVSICDLGDSSDNCLMDTDDFIRIVDKDIFVEDMIISADVGTGTGDGRYNPKKIRIFMWEKFK